MVLLAACAQGRSETTPPADGDAPAAEAAPPPSAAPAPAGEAGDTGRIARLEREARALAKTGGCATAEQCRTAPVGVRPCGGPRDYVAYCAATTDSTALFAKLEELRAAEDAYNRSSGMASTCEFREPPATELVGGSCRAAAPAGVTP
jgi:hypothetical protein